MTWYVYALKDPRNGAIRYVGKSLNPAQRMHAHRSRVGSAKVRARSLDCSVEWLVTGEGCQARTEAA